MNGGSVQRWKPIEAPRNVEGLRVPELTALAGLWERERSRLQQLGLFQVFWDRWARRWSVETGFIEGRYDISRAGTEVLVEQGFHANLLQHGDTDTDPDLLMAILRDHLDGLEFVKDLIGAGLSLVFRQQM